MSPVCTIRKELSAEETQALLAKNEHQVLAESFNNTVRDFVVENNFQSKLANGGTGSTYFRVEQRFMPIVSRVSAPRFILAASQSACGARDCGDEQRAANQEVLRLVDFQALDSGVKIAKIMVGHFVMEGSSHQQKDLLVVLSNGLGLLLTPKQNTEL